MLEARYDHSEGLDRIKGRYQLPFTPIGTSLRVDAEYSDSRIAEGVMRVINDVNSPWLRATLDTGNFFERRHEQFEMMAPEIMIKKAIEKQISNLFTAKIL